MSYDKDTSIDLSSDSSDDSDESLLSPHPSPDRPTTRRPTTTPPRVLDLVRDFSNNTSDDDSTTTTNVQNVREKKQYSKKPSSSASKKRDSSKAQPNKAKKSTSGKTLKKKSPIKQKALKKTPTSFVDGTAKGAEVCEFIIRRAQNPDGSFTNTMAHGKQGAFFELITTQLFSNAVTTKGPLAGYKQVNALGIQNRWKGVKVYFDKFIQNGHSEEDGEEGETVHDVLENAFEAYQLMVSDIAKSTGKAKKTAAIKKKNEVAMIGNRAPLGHGMYGYCI